MAKLASTQQQLRSQGEAIGDGLQVVADKAAASVTRMKQMAADFFSRKRAEAVRRPTREGLAVVRGSKR